MQFYSELEHLSSKLVTKPNCWILGIFLAKSENLVLTLCCSVFWSGDTWCDSHWIQYRWVSSLLYTKKWVQGITLNNERIHTPFCISQCQWLPLVLLKLNLFIYLYSYRHQVEQIHQKNVLQYLVHPECLWHTTIVQSLVYLQCSFICETTKVFSWLDWGMERFIAECDSTWCLLCFLVILTICRGKFKNGITKWNSCGCTYSNTTCSIGKLCGSCNTKIPFGNQVSVFSCGDRCDSHPLICHYWKWKFQKCVDLRLCMSNAPNSQHLAYLKCILTLILWTCIAFDREKNVSGAAVTPYVLKRVNELTGGASLAASILFLSRLIFSKGCKHGSWCIQWLNVIELAILLWIFLTRASDIELIKNNARVGSRIAVALASHWTEAAWETCETFKDHQKVRLQREDRSLKVATQNYSTLLLCFSSQEKWAAECLQ